jgi:hypothetical protein
MLSKRKIATISDVYSAVAMKTVFLQADQTYLFLGYKNDEVTFLSIEDDENCGNRLDKIDLDEFIELGLYKVDDILICYQDRDIYQHSYYKPTEVEVCCKQRLVHRDIIFIGENNAGVN